MNLNVPVITEKGTNKLFPLGAHYEAPDGKMYKYVQYKTAAGAVAAVANQVAYYYAPGGVHAGIADVNKVTSDLSDSNEVGAGMLQSAPADGEYCWIQLKGIATSNLALTAGADGDPMTPTGSTDGTLDVSAAVTDAVCAYAMDISAKIILCDFPF